MIPRAALLLGLAGLIPFAACALAGLIGWPGFLDGRADLVMVQYGLTILAFMSGVLWGFATRATGPQAAWGYAASVIPALWAFYFAFWPTPVGIAALMAGFGGLLLLDWAFWRAGLAPSWWMRLRLILSAGVLASLALGLYA